MTRRKIISDSDVLRIRAEHKPGVRGHGYKEIARRYGVSESTIRDLITFRTRWDVRGS